MNRIPQIPAQPSLDGGLSADASVAMPYQPFIIRGTRHGFLLESGFDAAAQMNVAIRHNFCCLTPQSIFQEGKPVFPHYPRIENQTIQLTSSPGENQKE